jgi:hypothetical protein
MTVGSESAAGLSELAAEFPGYDFGTQRTWDGVSIIAIRQDRSGRPGLCVVITADVDEMRHALLEGERQQDGTLPGGALHGDALHGDALPEPRVGSLGEDRR